MTGGVGLRRAAIFHSLIPETAAKLPGEAGMQLFMYLTGSHVTSAPKDKRNQIQNEKSLEDF